MSQEITISPTFGMRSCGTPVPYRRETSIHLRTKWIHMRKGPAQSSRDQYFRSVFPDLKYEIVETRRCLTALDSLSSPGTQHGSAGDFLPPERLLSFQAPPSSLKW